MVYEYQRRISYSESVTPSFYSSVNTIAEGIKKLIGKEEEEEDVADPFS